MKTVAFIYGWAEGAWQAKQLAGDLAKHGFRLTRHPEKADVVLAHSAGCYMVPQITKAKLIVLIGLPYWPGKPLHKSLIEKLKLEAKKHKNRGDYLWFANKIAHNLWYILTRPHAMYRFIKNYRQLKLPKASQKQQVILIRNSDDRFCTPEVAQILPQAKGYKFLELPGLHDDCWIEPEPYIKIIRNALNELA